MAPTSPPERDGDGAQDGGGSDVKAAADSALESGHGDATAPVASSSKSPSLDKCKDHASCSDVVHVLRPWTPRAVDIKEDPNGIDPNGLDPNLSHQLLAGLVARSMQNDTSCHGWPQQAAWACEEDPWGSQIHPSCWAWNTTWGRQLVLANQIQLSYWAWES